MADMYGGFNDSHDLAVSLAMRIYSFECSGGLSQRICCSGGPLAWFSAVGGAADGHFPGCGDQPASSLLRGEKSFSKGLCSGGMCAWADDLNG